MPVPPGRPDWRNPANYEYTRELTREGWAWEFLRRNPKYREAWNEHWGCRAITIRSLGDNMHVIEAPLASPQERQIWGLLFFEDPDLTSAAASVFWSPEACSSVLPVHTARTLSDDAARPLPLSDLGCTMALLPGDGEQHVLFSDGGRWLQIAVTGADPLGGAGLLATAIVTRRLLERRLQLLRRLSSLAESGRLVPQLYPPDPRGDRLCLILQALDGDSDRASQREIAVALFGARRVSADWTHPGNTLRDRIRRAVRRARWLVNGGYLRLLK